MAKHFLEPLMHSLLVNTTRLARVGLRLIGTPAAPDVALTKKAEAMRWFWLPSEGTALAEEARPPRPGGQKALALIVEPKRYAWERLHGGNHNGR